MLFRSPTGGGNIAIIGQGNDDQVIEAAWEFVKFLMTDDQVAENAANTGYLPTTYSASNYLSFKNYGKKPHNTRWHMINLQ